VIKSFKDRETGRIYQLERSAKLPGDIQQTAARKLKMLNNARELRDLASPPGNKLEKLKGHRSDQHSIRINDQWRVCFRWHDGDAYEVEITDYH